MAWAPRAAYVERMAQLAIVVNPTKFDDLGPVKESAAAVCARHGWDEPRWYETTADDPGRGQAKQALAEGAELVCPLGGDGTVRAVAEALVGGDVPIGLLPGGTGNLLARNLGLPIDDLDEALQVALTGAERRVDVGRIALDEEEPTIFPVMAGMGLDAEMMKADEGLKKRLGPAAYLIAGVRALFQSGFRVEVSGAVPKTRFRHARTVLVGNCGELTGGVALFPDADIDDGVLDAVLAAPRGLVGWAAVLADVITRHRSGYPGIQRYEGTEFTLRTSREVEAQIDGDGMGPRRKLRAWCEPASLVVRVKKEEQS